MPSSRLRTARQHCAAHAGRYQRSSPRHYGGTRCYLMPSFATCWTTTSSRHFTKTCARWRVLTSSQWKVSGPQPLEPAIRRSATPASLHTVSVRWLRLRRHVRAQPVGLEAAHVRWWASGGPDVVENAVCLCSLHHKLLDTLVLGLTDEHRPAGVDVLRCASETAQRMVLDLAGRNLLDPQRGQPRVLVEHADWHTTQVFIPCESRVATHHRRPHKTQCTSTVTID
jgi:hypothetical protein